MEGPPGVFSDFSLFNKSRHRVAGLVASGNVNTGLWLCVYLLCTWPFSSSSFHGAEILIWSLLPQKRRGQPTRMEFWALGLSKLSSTVGEAEPPALVGGVTDAEATAGPLRASTGGAASTATP